MTEANITVLQAIFDFIVRIKWVIFSIVFIVLCKEGFLDLIKRLTNLVFKRGKTEFGITAKVNGSNTESKDLEKSVIEKEKKYDEESIAKEKEEVEGNLFYNMHIAFEDGDIEKAKKIFKQYKIETEDREEVYTTEALYLYFLYSKGNDNNALIKLEQLVDNAPNEDLKMNGLMWLAICYRLANGVEEDIMLWQKTLPNLKNSENITKCTEQIAAAFRSDGRPEEGLAILENRLREVNDENEKFILYKAISKIESDLNNDAMSALCLERALQLKPDDHDLLFKAAYSQSDASLNILSIYNYNTLLKFKDKDSTTLNNIGVDAESFGLKILANNYYNRSTAQGSTLAQANIGNNYLGAGFHNEAEKLVDEGLKAKEPHENLYKLKTNILKQRKKEEEKFNKILEKSIVLKKHFENYVDCYYSNVKKYRSLFSGLWYSEDGLELNAEIEKDNILINWESGTKGLLLSVMDSSNYKFTISGSIKNKSARIKYKKDYTPSGGINPLIIGIGSEEYDCYSYLEKDLKRWTIFSIKYDHEFNMSLFREKPSDD